MKMGHFGMKWDSLLVILTNSRSNTNAFLPAELLSCDNINFEQGAVNVP